MKNDDKMAYLFAFLLLHDLGERKHYHCLYSRDKPNEYFIIIITTELSINTIRLFATQRLYQMNVEKSSFIQCLSLKFR